MAVTVTQVSPFVALAEVYQAAGFTTYIESLAPHLLNLIFEQDWVGGSVVDLGCGTGELAHYLCEQGLRTFAVDTCREMLVRAESTATPKGLAIEWMHGDARAFQLPIKVDLVTCIGTLNLLPTVNDLELAFRAVSSALELRKFFIFDLMTIRGLAASVGDRIAADTETALVITRSEFSFETLLLNQTYHLLNHDGTNWQRALEKHTLRGYPVAPIGKLLAKYGLHLLRTVDTNLRPVDPNEADRVLFLAQKEA